MISSAKKAKCPVTFVVKVFTAKTPVIFTNPATKESNVANLRLWAKVLFFPLWRNIILIFCKNKAFDLKKNFKF